MRQIEKNPAKIQLMFSSIAPRYDLLNKLLSFGRDRYWRKFAVNTLPKKETGLFLDVASGTGDIAIEIVRQSARSTKIIGVDFSEQMLEFGIKKIKKMNLNGQIDLRFGDITSLPFEDKVFDGAIIAFGIRNIPDYKTGIKEMARVVRDGGKVVILEFTNAQTEVFKWPFRVYLTKLMPWIGGIISGRKSAYTYLSNSVLDFPDPGQLKKVMEKSDLKDIEYHTLTFGTVAVHVGTK